jgi:hypothetical protein
VVRIQEPVAYVCSGDGSNDNEINRKSGALCNSSRIDLKLDGSISDAATDRGCYLQIVFQGCFILRTFDWSQNNSIGSMTTLDNPVAVRTPVLASCEY